MEEQGTVKFFNLEKRFGFLTPNGGELGVDVFLPGKVLAKAGIKSLEAGSRVSFHAITDMATGRRRAVSIAIVREQTGHTET
jgi:cold shock protein